MSIVKLTKDNFEEVVLKNNDPVLVDFWSEACGPCKTMGVILEKIAPTLEGVVIGKVDIMEEGELAQEYKISAIPSLLYFKNGELVDQTLGVQSEATLRDKLESLKG